LFIIHINDIIKVCPDKCNIKIFADDTLIFVSGDGSEELEHKMNGVFYIRLIAEYIKNECRKNKVHDSEKYKKGIDR